MTEVKRFNYVGDDAEVEKEREQCLHVQKRGARSLILCPCVAAMKKKQP